jgi:hypothetical protein
MIPSGKTIAGACFFFAIALSPLAQAQNGGAAERTNPPAQWSTPGDGRLVMLARNSAGFNTPMPVRVQVCVTNLTGSNNSVNLYVWTTANQWDATPAATQQQTRHLDLGDCVEIDRPAALIVQDSTISGTSSGYYQLMEQTPVPPSVMPPDHDPASGRHQNPPRKDGRGIWLEDMKPVTIHCRKIEPPTDDFYTRCDLPLPVDPKPRQGVRICIGNNFVTWRTPAQQINYAASLLDLVVAPEFQPPANKPQPYDYNWNPVTPNGCRDIIGTSPVTFLVGPNTAGAYWDPSTVTDISMSTQVIHWNEQ